jgi:2-keto-4-pentenoate hydratase/2-oxohepta-3-ene-1,7-dioic acid hydratase in catechol pathway
VKRVKIEGEEYFPSKVICVGKNYKAHIAEMGGVEIPSEPTIFIKPNSALSFNPSEVDIPERLGLLHHEVELCFIVRRRLKDATEGEAEAGIAGYAVGIDFTLRDLQSSAKKAGLPWTLSKGFDSSAVVGNFVKAGRAKSVSNSDIFLSIDGVKRQGSNTSQMIFSPHYILSYASRYMTVEEGDIFMCGTPEGVSEVRGGDSIHAEISGLPPLRFTVNRS